MKWIALYHTMNDCSPIWSNDIMDNSVLALRHIIISAIVVTVFVITKTLIENLRQRYAQLTVIVIGAGPIGLSALMVAARSCRVRRILLIEERNRQALCTVQPHQIALDVPSLKFLRSLSVDFENMEGCWHQGCFYTKAGVFQDYIISVLHRLPVPVDIRLGTKCTLERIKEVEMIGGRKLILVCDGANGLTARCAGLSEDYIQHSCRFYGSVAVLERPNECPIPLRERLQHNIYFDLTAYGGSESCLDVDAHQGFSLNIFGTSTYRFMVLLVLKNESPSIKSLRIVLDQSMMRNIFMKCFNTYKSESETSLSEAFALKYMKFSPRLFEVKLSERVETVAYFQDTDTFVVCEGEAARCYNVHTGRDVNIGIDGLQSLSAFITQAAISNTNSTILATLLWKSRKARQICKDFLKSGLRERTKFCHYSKRM